MPTYTKNSVKSLRKLYERAERKRNLVKKAKNIKVIEDISKEEISDAQQEIKESSVAEETKLSVEDGGDKLPKVHKERSVRRPKRNRKSSKSRTKSDKLSSLLSDS